MPAYLFIRRCIAPRPEQIVVLGQFQYFPTSGVQSEYLQSFPIENRAYTINSVSFFGSR